MFLTIFVILFLMVPIPDPITGQHLSSQTYRRQMNLMRNMAQKAYEHGIRINEEARCSKPHPELIYLNDSKKIYLPRATMLHRCSDRTGCCPHATHSCEPSRVEKVTLYFFAISVQSPTSHRIRQGQNIEQLTFLNHTDCECKPIDPILWTEQLRVNSNFGDAAGTTLTMVNNQSNLRTIRDHQMEGSQVIPYVNGNGLDTIPEPYLFSVTSSPTSRQNSVGIIQGRTSYQSPITTTNDAYKESENILKYWAKLLGYNADQHQIRKRILAAGSNRNTRLKVKPSKPTTIATTYYSRSSPEVTYRFHHHHHHHPQTTTSFQNNHIDTVGGTTSGGQYQTMDFNSQQPPQQPPVPTNEFSYF